MRRQIVSHDGIEQLNLTDADAGDPHLHLKPIGEASQLWEHQRAASPDSEVAQPSHLAIVIE